MAKWEIAKRDERCGYDWCPIAAGEPMQVIDGLHKRRVRCQAHAIGGVDEAAIERAYLEADEVALERELARSRAVARGFDKLFGGQRGLPFDRKRAAIAEDDQ